MEINVSIFYKQTPNGFRVWSDFTESSIYKGMSAWGKTKESARINLWVKFNKLSLRDRNFLSKSHRKITVKLFKLIELPN